MIGGKVETWKRLGELLGGEVGEGVVDSVRGEGGTGEGHAAVGGTVDDAGSLAFGGVGQASLEVETHLERRDRAVIEGKYLVPGNAAALRVEDVLGDFVALAGSEQKQHAKAFLRVLDEKRKAYAKDRAVC